MDAAGDGEPGAVGPAGTVKSVGGGECNWRTFAGVVVLGVPGSLGC